jgi:hypothetical protein
VSNKPKQLVKAAVTLLAALVAGNLIQRASRDRSFRRKASNLGDAARERARSAGKVIGDNLSQLAHTAGKQAPVIAREAAKQIRRVSKAAAG